MNTDVAVTLIEVTLNGEPQRVRPGLSLEALVQAQGVAPHEVATALNGDFVPRAARGTTLLKPGDAVTCFRPIVGG